MSAAYDLLTEARGAGVTIDVDGTELLAEGPLTDELVNRLKEHKAELLRMLSAEVMDENAREHLEERAAIAEHDGELSRDEAQTEAARRVFEYRITDNPRWLMLIAAPGEGLLEVQQSLRLRYRERLEAVRPYQWEPMELPS